MGPAGKKKIEKNKSGTEPGSFLCLPEQGYKPLSRKKGWREGFSKMKTYPGEVAGGKPGGKARLGALGHRAANSAWMAEFSKFRVAAGAVDGTSASRKSAFGTAPLIYAC